MIGVCGLGNVGKAVYENLFKFYDMVGYDKDPKRTINKFDELLECDLIFLCLPTPTHSGHYLNTGLGAGQNNQAIYNVMSELRQHNYKGIVAIKSTVLPGTASKLQKEHPDITILSNPEFLSQESAQKDFKEQRKVIIGGEDEIAQRKLADVYGKLGCKTAFLVKLDEAETIKYFHNVFLAVKIATFNELYDAAYERKTNFQLCADLACEITGWISPRHVQVPGPDGQFGFGGDCFPKDIKAFLCKYHHLDLDIIKAAIQSNFNRRRGGSKAPKYDRAAFKKYFLTAPKPAKKKVPVVG